MPLSKLAYMPSVVYAPLLSITYVKTMLIKPAATPRTSKNRCHREACVSSVARAQWDLREQAWSPSLSSRTVCSQTFPLLKHNRRASARYHSLQLTLICELHTIQGVLHLGTTLVDDLSSSQDIAHVPGGVLSNSSKSQLATTETFSFNKSKLRKITVLRCV